MKRKTKFSNGLMFDIFYDFRSGISIDEISKKYNVEERDVKNILLKTASKKLPIKL